MVKVKPLDFTGETIYCALDVHKKSWRVNTRVKEFELEDYSQDPCVESLARHLRKRYPGARYKVVYEAGFCGFGIYRSLTALDIDCIVVNAADVPTSDKEKKRKQDKIDARKLGRELSSGHLEGIYIPEQLMEHARSLVRQRSRLVQDQTRCKNRIWQLLMFSGLQPDEEQYDKYWSHKFISMLKELPCGSEALRKTLDLAIEEYIQIRKLLSDATRQVRELSRTDQFSKDQELLQSIPGIGLINAMVLQTELQDIKRFRTLDHLCCYAGIVPDTADSGETKKNKGITSRSNRYLRPAIVESSWVIIRRDPAMLMKYKKYCRRMHQNKAIIKIARHLLARIRHVWVHQTKYETAIVG